MTLAEHLESIKMMSRDNLLKLKEGDKVIVSRFNNKKRAKFVVSEVVSDTCLCIKEKSGIEIMIDTLKNCHIELSGKAWAGVYICQN